MCILACVTLSLHQAFPPSYLFTTPAVPLNALDESPTAPLLASYCYAPPPTMPYEPPPPYEAPSAGVLAAALPAAVVVPPMIPHMHADAHGGYFQPPLPAVAPHAAPHGAPAFAQPVEEYTLDCSDGNEITTDVYCDAGQAERVTHLNLFHVRCAAA